MISIQNRLKKDVKSVFISNYNLKCFDNVRSILYAKFPVQAGWAIF